MIDKQINDCAKYLFDTLKQDYPEHSELWYLVDNDKFERYYKDFENALLNCLKTEWNNLTREDLDKVASCFNAIARREKLGLYFPKNLYETIDFLGRKFLEKDGVNDLCRFIACNLKVKDDNLNNNQIDNCKKNVLSLSFDSDPNPFKKDVDLFSIGKGEALIRGTKKKIDLDQYDITLLYENEIKKLILEKELHHVNWIRETTDKDVSQKNKFDFILLTDPFLYTPNVYVNDDETDYIVEGVKDYNPLPDTLSKYGKLLKESGKLLLIADYLVIDNILLQHIENENEDNKLYIETVANLYIINKELNTNNVEYFNNINSKFTIIVSC